VGTCSQGETIVGDGSRALFGLSCERGRLVADVVLDAQSGKATLIRLSPDRTDACVP
jgi:hypothetical protein